MKTATILGKEYLPRTIDTTLADYLSFSGAVVLEGPRGCGKTMTATNAAASALYLDDPDTKQLVEANISFAFKGERPRLIDEWQIMPEIWNGVRRQVDLASDFGQFILTGSAVPDDDKSRHTGAARFLRLRQYTMSWFEKQVNSEANVSLTKLFAGETVTDGPTGADYSALVERLCTSGFPRFIKLTPAQALIQAQAYLNESVHTDLKRLDNIRYAPAQLQALINSIARMTASEGQYSKIAADLETVIPAVRNETIARYCELLQRIFVLDLQPAWSPALRSRSRLRTSPKWHLADASLAVAALQASPEKLETDINTTGFLFESQVVHDLRTLAIPQGGKVYHYRDSSGRELDAVIELPDGRWGAIEVKISGNKINEGASSLNKAIEHITTPPAFRLVITAMGPTFTLADGTVTCPLEALRP